METWNLGILHDSTSVNICRSLISEFWSSFSLPVANRPVHIAPILHLVEQLCLALNDEFRKMLLVVFFSYFRFCISWSNFAWHSTMNSESIFLIYFPVVFKFLLMQRGLMTTHMLFLFSTPLKFLVGHKMSICIFFFLHLFRLFKMDTPVEVRRGAIKTLTRLIPYVQVILDTHLRLCIT